MICFYANKEETSFQRQTYLPNHTVPTFHKTFLPGAKFSCVYTLWGSHSDAEISWQENDGWGTARETD